MKKEPPPPKMLHVADVLQHFSLKSWFLCLVCLKEKIFLFVSLFLHPYPVWGRNESTLMLYYSVITAHGFLVSLVSFVSVRLGVGSVCVCRLFTLFIIA